MQNIHFFLENDLFFEVFMESGGKAIIKGNYQECPDKDNKLLFEIETDQTCFKPVIMGIDRLKEKIKTMTIKLVGNKY